MEYAGYATPNGAARWGQYASYAPSNPRAPAYNPSSSSTANHVQSNYADDKVSALELGRRIEVLVILQYDEVLTMLSADRETSPVWLAMYLVLVALIGGDKNYRVLFSPFARDSVSSILDPQESCRRRRRTLACRE